MADWKQITARIRRARTSKDPAGQLTGLFLKTRDAMVAFELARYFEANGKSEDAGKWYMTAAERFRRADWKTKAQESATRLGATVAAEIPAPATPADLPEVAASDIAVSSPSPEPATQEAPPPAAEAPPEDAHQETGLPERSPAKRRRRGRRGGRGHRRPSKHPEQTVTTASEARPAPAPPRAVGTSEWRPVHPAEPLEASVEAPLAPSLRGRSGDPGLASRLAQLEMNFRRLLACPPTKLEAADKAPAGPGVWVLTDSDLATYYYVESCQTLRVAIPNLIRGSAARRGDSIRPKLAEHLGIPESRVAKYLADHCVVRWLQMDDDAAHFAHFLIAVLHPALNE
jgi:hypothetical protein